MNAFHRTRGATLHEVDGLHEAMTVELFLKDDMLDVCLQNRRTLSSRVANGSGDGLMFFSEGGELRLESIEIRPLRDQARP